jgi:cytoskeletal protein RodZ
MQEDKDILKDIFSNKLTDYKATPDPEQWTALQKDLKKKRFFRFGFWHFNIYQIAFLLAALCLLTFAIVYRNSTSNDTPPAAVNTNDSLPANDSTVDITSPTEEKETDDITKKETNKIHNNTKQIPDAPILNEPIEDNLNVPIVETPIVTDTIKPKQEEKAIAPQTTLPKKKITIIEIDTVKVKKRRKK